MNLEKLQSIKVEFFDDNYQFNAPDIHMMNLERNMRSTMVGLFLDAYTYDPERDIGARFDNQLFLYGNLELYGDDDGLTFKITLNEGQEWLLTYNMIYYILHERPYTVNWQERPVLIYEKKVLSINQPFFFDLMKKIKVYLEDRTIGNIIFKREEFSTLSTHFQVSAHTHFYDEYEYGGDYYDYHGLDNEIPDIEPEFKFVSPDKSLASLP